MLEINTAEEIALNFHNKPLGTKWVSLDSLKKLIGELTDKYYKEILRSPKHDKSLKASKLKVLDDIAEAITKGD